MTELDVIKSTPEPRTRASLSRDLRRLGIDEGMLVLVHSSLKSLGWVNGGPVTVIHSLLDVLTPQGTLVMPAHTSGLSDPALWEAPPVPEGWWSDVRDTMPAFDPQRTPTSGIGRIPELFRTWPDVRRSDHPVYSFAACGRLADALTSAHSLSYGLGPGSPLDAIYANDGHVLLLGADYESNTSFHLAEYRLDWMPHIEQGAPVMVRGERTWQFYDDLDLDTSDFAKIGQAFERVHAVKIGRVGSADARFFSMREVVDFAARWMQSHRKHP